MKQLRNVWTPRFIVAATLTAAVFTAAPVYGQQANQPSDTYQGVSQPPPDDTITSSPDAPATASVAQSSAVKPSPAVPAATPSYANSAATARSAQSDPDYDIVTSVPSQSQAGTSGAALQTRDPDAGIVTSVPTLANELPEGTNVRVRLAEQLSTKDTTAGSPFKGEVTTAVFKDGRIIIPPGSILKGRVMSVRQGHHFTGAATIHLRPDMIVLPDGTAYHLYAQVVQTGGSATRTDSEGGIQPSSHWKKDTAEYGVGAGTGALVGAKIAGPQGALIGAGVGATLVTAHLLMEHPADATLPAGSVVTFSLSEPMELTPTRN